MKSANWRKFYWLDMCAFFSSFLAENEELIAVKYFTATPTQNSKAKRQDKLFQANQLNKKFKIIRGTFLLKKVDCPSCLDTFEVPEEKKTDVSIAVNLISDVVNDQCDVSILVTGDSDLTPPIEFLNNYKKEHEIRVFFPPERSSLHLKQLSKHTTYLGQFKQRFKQHQLQDTVVLEDGYVIQKPVGWV